MALSTRERNITLIVLIACAALILDRLAVEPYLATRRDLVEQRQKRRHDLDQANLTLRREAQYRRTIAQWSKSIQSDPASAEAQLLHLVHDLEQQSGAGNASFQRVRSLDDHGYTSLTYHVSAAGNMASLATLLWRIETAGIPLRVEDVQITPRHEDGNELIVQFNLSTLAQSDKSHPAPSEGASLAALGGGK
jgi:hypothetical protein